MLETLFIAIRLQIAYTMNGIQYFVRRIPLIKRLFWDFSYDAPALKIIFLIFATGWKIIKKFAAKAAYLLIIMALCGVILDSVEPSSAGSSHLFVQTLFILTILGGLINNPLFNTKTSDYYAICLLRMDSRKYVLSQYAFYLFHSIITYFIGMLLIGFLIVKVSFIDVLLIPIFMVLSKLAFSYMFIRSVERPKKTFDNIMSIVYCIVFVAVAVALPFINIFIPINVMRIIMLIFIIPAIFGIYKIISYDKYSIIYRREILYQRAAIEQASAKNKSEAAIRRNSISDDASATSSKQGFAYMHELFVKRHVKLLWKPSLVLSAVMFVCFFLTVVFMLIVPNVKGVFGGHILKFLTMMPFIMYFLNRGLPFTQALYVNCDHSMLTFSFYKTPSAILRLFVLRLRTIIAVNFLPSLIIGLGLDAVHLLSTVKTAPADFVVIPVTVIAIGVFFSVHYLVIYYLLQPYNAATEVKSPAYTAAKIITYVVCYFLMQLEISSIAFGVAAIIFCVIYCIVGCILVYFLAPKTFRIRN